MNYFSLYVETFELIINNNQYNIAICWFSDIVTFPNIFLIILTSGLFRSHLPKPGVDTETSRYPSHWSGCPIGSSETHAGSGSQCWDDDAKPQWNHPECECQTVKKNPFVCVMCDWWLICRCSSRWQLWVWAISRPTETPLTAWGSRWIWA